MSTNHITPASLGKKYRLVLLTLVLLIVLSIIAFLTKIVIKDFIADGFSAITGIIGLFIVAKLKNKALTLGWIIYLSALIVDLVDEIILLPIWLDDDYEAIAYGIGLFIIVMAFYLIVKEKQETVEHFQGVSNRDDLTGLYNHRYFYEYFQQSSTKSNNLILLFCDLDYFKSINDFYGHITGDRVLMETAQTIKQTMNDKGACFRYGGEEFAVLLENCEMDQASGIAEELIRNINACQSLQQNAVYFPVTLSIGLATYPQNASSAQDLVEKADRAMYYSKQNGKNQFNIYSPETENSLEQGNVQGIKQKMLINSVFSLASAIDAKDRYTGRHSELVTKYALQIAEVLKIPEEGKFRLRIGAVLHDCGKIGMPDDIINKTGELAEQEYATVKNHTLLGYNIIKHITDDTEIISCVLSHHEHWDGKGYPHGLTETSIPLFARIISIADAFHAMTSDRPYRSALTPGNALEELRKYAGSQFDPELVKYFIEIQSGINRNIERKDYIAS